MQKSQYFLPHAYSVKFTMQQSDLCYLLFALSVMVGLKKMEICV